MSFLLELKHINKQYQKKNSSHTDVLTNLNLSVRAGEMLAIIGSSGSGKSSLMHIVGLLDQHYQGDYFFLEKDISTLTADQRSDFRNRHIGFVFQSFYLLPRLSALENVMLPLQYQKTTVFEAKKRALALLEKMDLTHLASHRPDQLSGGQMQRVAIARALVTDPDLILADEPTGALDSETGKMVLHILSELNQQGKTVMLVTHDHAISAECHRVLKLQGGTLV